jgi:hypothetical protein
MLRMLFIKDGNMNILIDYAPALAIAAVVFGLLCYGVALLIAAFVPQAPAVGAQIRWFHNLSATLRAWFSGATAQNLGIPCGAISAFAIVTVLLRTFPPKPNDVGLLAFKAFGLEFSGPAGPITLWLMCFLGFVVSLKLLR